MPALDPETLDRWRDSVMVDQEGGTVGTISEFYLDRETGQPTWALVATGLFGAKQTFVPLTEATQQGNEILVPYTKARIREAPQVGAEGELTPDEEATLFAHYGLDYWGMARAAEPGTADPGAVGADPAPDPAPEADPAPGTEAGGTGIFDQERPAGSETERQPRTRVRPEESGEQTGTDEEDLGHR